MDEVYLDGYVVFESVLRVLGTGDNKVVRGTDVMLRVGVGYQVVYLRGEEGQGVFEWKRCI